MQLIDLLWQTLINPNIAYLLLIAGIWALVFAFVTPGTGIPEAAGLFFLSLAVLGLTRLPVNVAGLALIILSATLFLLELKWPSHGAFIGAAVIALTSGSLFLFRSEETSTRLSLGVVAMTVLATAAFFVFAVGKALETRRRPPLQNPDAIIGAHGEARTDIAPEGSVQVGAELWSAEADESIPAGTKVRVVQRTGLKLKVVRI